MNSDYVLKGKGQITLHQPDWAKFTPSSGSRMPAAASSTAIADSPLPTQKAGQKTGNKSAAQPVPQEDDIEEGQPRQSEKSRFNAWTHGGSKKSVGPDVDNVDYTFEDFLDTINPLQQIPIVNMIYRHLTGDKISGVSQVMGSALFWGPTGIITGAVDAIFEQEKGGDMGETIVASLLGTETPNAKNLPSNNPIKGAPGYNSGTMLADAEPEEIDEDAAPIAVAEEVPLPVKTAPAKSHKVATKLPFGGVMGNEQAPPVANVNAPVANDTDAVNPAAPAPAKPVPHAPIQEEGGKLYSLAGVIRHVGSPSNMPIREVPDARLKAYGKQATKPDPAALLGLQSPAANLAGTPVLNDDDMPETRLPDPGFAAPLAGRSTPSGNPIPAQLIQDMMMLNMQKYQNDMKNGTLRGSSVDVNG